MNITLADVSSLFGDAISPPFLNQPTSFSLDISGILGLLGGDDVMSAMATTHIHGNRYWLGWYNTPGSFQIFRRLVSFSSSVSPTGLLSGSIYTDPNKLLKSDACKGPKFRAAHSGTVMEETGYLAALFMKECATRESEGRVVPGRKTQPIGITIAHLGHIPDSEIHPTCNRLSAVLFAGVPIATSFGTCALCTIFEDLWAALSILVGIMACGVSCLALGSADFAFTHPIPARGSPVGDGILSLGKNIVLLKGEEGAVNAITRGNFTLRFSSQSHYNLIRWTSHLFLVQCIMQLFLIPQASLFGQVMFLISFGVSALYNTWVSSVDKEKVHRSFFFEQILENPRLSKYTLGTHASAVVFILLVLQPQDLRGMLNELMPNDTKVRKQWKKTILEQLRHHNGQSFRLDDKMGRPDGFTQEEWDLLVLLYDDARAANDGYKDYLQTNSL